MKDENDPFENRKRRKRYKDIEEFLRHYREQTKKIPLVEFIMLSPSNVLITFFNN